MKNRAVVIITITVLMLMSACSAQQQTQPAVSADAINTETAQTVEDAAKPQSEPTAAATESRALTPSEVEPAAEEDDIVYSSILADRGRTLTIKDLNELADFVITGVCLSSKPDYQEGFLYTVSEIKIDTVYRGENMASCDTITIIEMGGRSTYGEQAKHAPKVEKSFYTGEPMPSDDRFVLGMDGHFPLKEGEQVLLFLGDTTGYFKSIEGTTYCIWGDYDGKLFLQPDGVTYSTTLSSENDQLIFGEGTFKITVDELKEKIGKDKPAAQ